MRCFILARQSSGDNDESLSIDSQVQECLKLCETGGHQVIDIFRDYNTSGRLYPTGYETLAAIDVIYQQFVKETGKTSFRKGLGDVLSRLNEVEALMVFDVTRLYRPLNGSYLGNLIIQRLTQANVKVISVKEGLLDFSTFQTQLITGLTSSINSEQLLINREKAKKSFQALRANGQWSAQLCKVFGYAPTGRKHEVDIVPHRAEIVRQCFKLFLEGKTYYAIAKELNHLMKDDPKCERLYKTQFWRLLKNPIYCGYWRLPDGSLTKADPLIGKEIISYDTWKKTQEKLSLRKDSPSRAKVYFLPLSGRLVCGYCKHKINPHKGGTTPHLELRCRAHMMLDRPSCRNGVAYDTISDGGVGFIDAIIPLAAVFYNDAFDLAVSDESLSGEVEKLEVALRNVRTKSGKIRKMLMDDLMDEDECEDMLKELRTRERDILMKLSELSDLMKERTSPEQYLSDISRAYSGELSNGELEVALRSVIKLVTLYKDHIEVKTTKGEFDLPCRKVKWTKCFPKPHEVIEVNEETGTDTYMIIYSYNDELTGSEKLKTLLDCGRLKYLIEE